MTKSHPVQSLSVQSLKQGTTDPELVETFYDDWARAYDATLQDWDYRAPADAARMLSPHLSTGARVLDVGCGTGLIGAALTQLCDCRLDGIDISEQSLALAQDRGLYERLVRHDLQDVPLPAASEGYDAATCIGVLTYIERPEGLLRDLCRCVRSGGHVAFTQRSDRWQSSAMADTIATLTDQGLWSVDMISKPLPYLPKNVDFGEEVKVIHTLCVVQ